MYSQTPNNAAVTALNSADTPHQPNPDLLLQYYARADEPRVTAFLVRPTTQIAARTVLI
jgi:hypothetical protein